MRPWRWQTALFFRWLQSHLGLVQLLVVLVSRALGYRRRLPQLLALLAVVLQQRRPTDLPAEIRQRRFADWRPTAWAGP